MKKLLCVLLITLLLLSLFIPFAGAQGAENVAPDGETVIELEDYYDQYGKENDNASEGKLLYSTWGSGTIEEIKLEIIINVEREGYYSTEYSASSRNGNEYLSLVQFAVDGAGIGDNNAKGTPIADGYMDDSNFIVYRYSGASVYLTPGEHTLQVTVGVTKDSRIKFAMDYVKFIPNQAQVVGGEKVILEFEDYADKFVTENENASGGKLVYTSWGTAVPTYTISIPVNVLSSGYYNSEFAVAKHPDKVGTSDVILKIDDTEIGSNKHTSPGEDISNGNTYVNETWPMHRYQGKTVFLEAGMHVLKAEVGTTGDSVVKFAADYIAVMPSAGFNVPASGARFEFEDFDEKYVTENENASNGKLLATSWGKDETYQVEFPVNLQENGFYRVEYSMAQHPNNIGVSDVQMLIDGAAIGDNAPGSGEDISMDKTYFNDILPMYVYSTELYFDKGSHVVTLDVKTTGNNVVKFAADYISFAKNMTDKAVVGDGTVEVIANFDKAVSGTAIAALYRGKQLVGMAQKPVSDESTVMVDVKSNEAPETAKMFIWENMQNIVPLAVSKLITNIENAPINIFLLGDSVCVQYAESEFPQQGWGYYMQEQFESGANVSNRAAGGTSTKTYQTLGYWEKAIAQIEEGDFVLINFGLNDFYNISETGKGTTIEQYKENLTMYCNEIFKKNATPVLVTPLPECKTSSVPALKERGEAMKEVGASIGVTVIDMNTALVEQWLTDSTGTVTEAQCTKAFEQYYLSEAAFLRLEKEYGKTVSDAKWEYIKNTPDRTHINIDGATFFAKTLCGFLKETDLRIADYLK